MAPNKKNSPWASNLKESILIGPSSIYNFPKECKLSDNSSSLRNFNVWAEDNIFFPFEAYVPASRVVTTPV